MRRFIWFWPALAVLLGGGLFTTAVAQPLNLILPTSNTALLEADGPSFYQYTDRYFEGKRSRPWEGGQYGFVRNPERTSDGIVFTRFHEGVDIQVLYRDRNGEPLDTVRTIDDGTVVYVNDNPGGSSYGKYVVVEHWWSGAPFYSLYAHLGRTTVRTGQRVAQGDILGRVGYTGRGINKRRAHLHFEINVLLNSDFGTWYASAYPRSANRHGIYNGINLAGLDVAALYLALADDPTLTIERFIAEKEAFFGVVVPNQGLPDLLVRYPWMLREEGPAADEPPAWEIIFTSSGFPMKIRRAYREVSAPALSMVREVALPYSLLTIGRLRGSGGAGALAARGLQYVSLVASPVNPQHESSPTFSGP